MEFFRGAPFLRILPSFCFGIVLAFFYDLDSDVFRALLILSASGLLYYLLIERIKYLHRFIPGILHQIIFLSFGFLITTVKDDRLAINHFSNFRPEFYKAKIDGQPVYKSGRLRAVANINSVCINSIWKQSCGKSYLYFPDSVNLSCNDEIVFRKQPVSIEPPLNPGGFDFSYYSGLRRVYHQVKLNVSEWKYVSSHSSIESYSIKLRNQLLKVFERAGLRGQEYAVMSALVLGYDDEIDKSTMAAFSASGTLHVLSVSGMHVGIIFAALTFILKFADRSRSLKVFRTFFLLISLWFYAILTGLSPSVIRSAMMFSFILIGASVSRSSTIYNSLALSALAIFLFFDPVLLFHPGLQLSFVAVAGIAYLYPRLYRIFYFDNWLADKVYSLIAVSIAAQLATFPLVIYYFHQFPNYFILANLIIIPLSTIGIFGGILLLFIYPFEFIFNRAGWFCEKVIHFLNGSAAIIERLPFSTTGGLMFGLPEVVLFFMFTVFLTEFFQQKRIKLFNAALITFSIFWLILILRAFQINQSNNLILFSGTKEICFQYNFGTQSILFHTWKDIIKARTFSDSYCNNSGRDITDRKVVLIDSIAKRGDNYLIGRNGKIILIGSNIILNNPDSVYKFNPLLTYYSDVKLFNSANSNKGTNIIINDAFNRKHNDIPKAFIHRLSEGSKTIYLKQSAMEIFPLF